MRWTVRILGGIVAVLFAIVAYFGIQAHRALPTLQGTLSIPGLKAEAAIERDARGLVTIRAASDADAYFALGYAHAQDRMWQMELTRRIGAGRMSELIGNSVIGIDRYVRTMGFYRLAEQQLAHLSPQARKALDAYAAGVNAWLENRDTPLPPQYQLLFIDPEPWKPADSLVWSRLMAFQLSSNMGSERTREQLARSLTPEQMKAILPGAAPDEPTSLTPAAQAALDAYLPPPALLTSGTASNAWVFSGDRTETGAPILANDPHLGFSMPNLWYFATIDSPSLKLSGVTVPGVPFHVLGHNRDIAWGLTTTYADTQDLFVETLSEDGTSYKTAAGWQRFETRTETISVRFGEPETLTIRASRNGPVISDLWQASDVAAGTAVALAFTGLEEDDTTPDALYRLNRARNQQEFLDAMRLYIAPVQNIHYADRSGTIGLIAPGRYPVRANGNGLTPVDGASGSHDWLGVLPFDAVPKQFNPPRAIFETQTTAWSERIIPI